MNANFERSGIFPLAVRPSDNYHGANPTGEHVIVNVNHPDKAIHLAINDEIEYVDFSRATMFPDVAGATLAAAGLIETASLKAAARVLYP